MKRFFVFLLFIYCFVQSAAVAESSDAEIVKRGKAVVQATFKELSGRLMQAMAKGGPTNAIKFCSVQALPFTQKIATQHGVKVRRMSHKPRNLKNVPNKREKEQLEEFAKSIAAKKPVLATHTDDDGDSFYAPITINNPLCLKCHGDPGRNISKETLKLIKGKYPNDKATGFALNNLRGMWVVEFADSVEQ